MASRERYVLKPQNLDGTGRNKSSSNRLASYVRNRNQMQLDESGGMNSFGNADMAVTYTGMGGFFLGGNSADPIRIDKTNSEASGIQNHHLAHRINNLNGNGMALPSYNSNWTIGGGSIGSPRPLNSGNFPELFEYKTVAWETSEDGIDSKQVYWIKNNWESLARRSYKEGNSKTTYFSCGYRGNDTSGLGTSVEHTWVKKKDKIWDVNVHPGTHCCTAAENRGIWQEGYDIWGKVIADTLISKSDWSSRRVIDYYKHKIYGKRSFGSTLADIVIYPISMIVGTYVCISKGLSKLFRRTKPL
jgi:hypothetical protein